MTIHIQGKSYLVLYTIEGEGDRLKQHICRDVAEGSRREYRAVRIPAEQVTGELVRFLMEQVQKKSFREFVDYATDVEGLTVLMDCGLGVPLADRLSGERLRLAERLELARRLCEQLVISDFPPYFLCAALGRERVKVTDAMDYSFNFDLSGLASYQDASLSEAFVRLAEVLSLLFQEELKRRAFPDMESFLYRLRRGGCADILSVYQELEAICRAWMDKDETRLESRSFAFRMWERIKGLGRFFKVFVKAAVVLLAAGYLAYSVWQFVQPEPVQEVYQSIGELEIRKQPEAGDQ